MENLKKIVQTLRSRSHGTTEDEIINVAREYLQVLVLKSIYGSKFGLSLSFMGGTCLRICYDLKRYSEDLDFCLDGPRKKYRFSVLMELLQKELALRGFSVATTAHEEKVVQKGFLRITDFQGELGLKSFHKDQKLHIKIEVDVHPPLLKPEERESFFVRRWNEIFPILKHNLETLFAGKILAILQRPYARGRDYYDLAWYLARQTVLNLDYLNRGLKNKEKFRSQQEVMAAVKKKVEEVKPALILKDVVRFLEDSSDEAWIRQYQTLVNQWIG